MTLLTLLCTFLCVRNGLLKGGPVFVFDLFGARIGYVNFNVINCSVITEHGSSGQVFGKKESWTTFPLHPVTTRDLGCVKLFFLENQHRF